MLPWEIWKCFGVNASASVICKNDLMMLAFENTMVGDYTVTLLFQSEKAQRETLTDTDSEFLRFHCRALPRCTLIHHRVVLLLLLWINLLIIWSIKCQKMCLYVLPSSCSVCQCVHLTMIQNREATNHHKPVKMKQCNV